MSIRINNRENEKPGPDCVDHSGTAYGDLTYLMFEPEMGQMMMKSGSVGSMLILSTANPWVP